MGPLNTPQYNCSVCPYEGQFWSNTVNPTCQCNTALYTPTSGMCLLNSDVSPVSTSYSVSNAQQIQYNFVETLQGNAITSQTISTSDTFNYLYYKASVGCS